MAEETAKAGAVVIMVPEITGTLSFAHQIVVIMDKTAQLIAQ
jgi:hypothetical protein